MKFNTKEIVTILRHCGNQGDACPCISCLLKDDPQGDTCKEMYNVAADEINRLALENIKLKELLKKAVEDMELLALSIRNGENVISCCDLCKFDPPACGECGEPFECPGFDSNECFRWLHADEAEEVLKDENT